jgi:thiaminase
MEPTRLPELLDGLRPQLEAVERQIREHPFLTAVEEGRAPLASLQAFAAEQRLIIASDRRSFAHLAARFPEPPAGDFFLDLAGGEGEALSLLAGFDASVGTGRDPYEPMPGCQAYPAFVAWLALNGGRADVALAFLVNLDAWGEACGRIAAALRERHDVSFFDFFASPPVGFADRALAVAEQGLEAGESPDRARRAARLLQAYELLYWDTLDGAL